MEVIISNINKEVIKAKSDAKLLEALITKNEKFILACASRAIGSYVTKSDEQWSVALLAYHEAVQTYSQDKGSFYSFANLVIKRRLIDYLKRESKHFCETAINPSAFSSDPNDDDDEQISLKHEVLAHLITQQDSDARLEIEALSTDLNNYGFAFFDLISVSPKALKTKSVCAKAISLILEDPRLIQQMRSTKTLPLKIIEKNAKLPRKILERHRKYIIAGAEILAGDYPIISEYLKFVREEQPK